MAPKTPHKTSIQIDATINDLNTKWNLDLPRLHGVDADNAEKDNRNSASRCSLAIRFLCWKSANLEGALEDFAEQAKVVLSAWIHKPRQQAGTLLSLPQTKSFIRRDVLAKQGGKLIPEQKERLLKILLNILSEEVRLINESDVYERTTSFSRNQDSLHAPSRSASFTGVASVAKSVSSATSGTVIVTEKNEDATRTSLRKRENTTHAQNASGKKQKRQSNLLESWAKNVDLTPTHSMDNLQSDVSCSATSPHLFGIKSAVASELTTSFNTTASSQTGKIFTDDEGHCRTSVSTSMTSSYNNHSQDLLPTQDIQELMNDESFLSNLDTADSPPDFSLEDLPGTGPFKKPQYPLPAVMPFWLKYELHRLSLSTNKPIWQIYHEVENACKTSSPNMESFWTEAKSIYAKNQIEKLAQKSAFKAWTLDEKMYENARDCKSVYFTGFLELQAEGNLLKLTLNPAKVDKSCRFHREYGADRFLMLTMPYFTADQLPQRLRDRYKDQDHKVHDIVMDWLATTDHHILGRIWRAFFLEAEKTQSKKRREAEGRRQKLHLFAIDGSDFIPGIESVSQRQHKPVSLLSFLNWHTPLEFNLDSSNLKLFSRFSLGLSKTVQTIELMPSEIYHVKDPEIGEVMNDGCALISLAFARAIWREYGDPHLDLPTAFQGRIAGAKGLWVVDFLESRPPLSERGYWIEVSDSQLKIKPHPQLRLDADASQRTFELLKFSKPCAVGHLNTQLINILDKQNVPRQLLQQALLRDIHDYIQGAKEAMTDSRKLRAWIQKFHPAIRDTEFVAYKGGLPDSREEEICLFLESGFEPKDCLHMRKVIKRMMTQELDSYVDKLRITLKHSTNVFCVPDPYGVLEPNQVYLGFSQEWENPNTKLMETSLDEIDVLVARNPAHLASDIQKRRAVYKRELRHFKNVIVFSTKGMVPTASLLSGGDYDGDTVTVIWDPEITSAFKNADKPELPSEKACGLENKSRKLSTIFQSSITTDAEVDLFFRGCISFNAYPDLLGICTSAFETLVYNIEDISSVGAVTLAALAGYLVDSSKQGWFLSNTAWSSLRKDLCDKPHWKRPAYKIEGGKPRTIDKFKNDECRNILDFLKFDVAQTQRENALIAFKHSFDDTDPYDIELSRLWHLEHNRYSQKSKDPERDAVAIVMNNLVADLQSAVTQWSKDISTLDEDSSKDFSRIAETASDRIQAIAPANVDCDIVRDFKMEGSGKGGRWSMLKASAMYYKHFHKTVVWYTVGDELCRLRARSKGATRELVPSMHYVLKADVKLIEKLCEQGNERDEDDKNLD